MILIKQILLSYKRAEYFDKRTESVLLSFQAEQVEKGLPFPVHLTPEMRFGWNTNVDMLVYL